jgi:glucarate dehydratase
MDPYHLEPLRLALRNPRLFAPLEEACLDLIGKQAGKRVCEVLGGPVREQVPYAAYMFFKEPGEDEWGEVLSPETMVGEAERFVERWGFKTLKVKGGVLHSDLEVETMLALRERFGPEFQLRIDPNAIWSVETSRRVAYKLRDCDLEYLEDPCAGIAGMALVAASTHIPLATNMCVIAFEHLPPAIAANAVQVVLSDHHLWGGLRRSALLAGIVDTFGMELSMHSNSHLGVSLAAMVHLAAASKNLTYACDTHYPWKTQDVVVPGTLEFRDGEVSVPTAPGLGVELDRDRLDELHEQYLACGVRRREDTTYMQSLEPAFVPNTARW